MPSARKGGAHVNLVFGHPPEPSQQRVGKGLPPAVEVLAPHVANLLPQLHGGPRVHGNLKDELLDVDEACLFEPRLEPAAYVDAPAGFL